MSWQKYNYFFKIIINLLTLKNVNNIIIQMKNLKYLLLIICCLITAESLNARTSSSIFPENLTCEYAEAPVLDIQNPRLSWINVNPDGVQGAAQTAYRIRVSDSPEGFRKPVWDSGKVISDDSAFITYDGAQLRPCTTYWWQVKVWDESGKPSQWSEPASWHMGILSQDGWKGQWIGAPWQGEKPYDMMKSTDVLPAPILRKEFSLQKKVRKAFFYGTGLGYFELYVNGQRVGEDYLSPNQTNYHTRPELDTRYITVEDPFEEYLVMYLTYDLTEMLQNGTNTVGAVLGNGFFDPVQRWPLMGYGTPRFMGQLEIEYEDGTKEVIASDTTWKAEKSAILSDQIFLGEHYDARLEHKGWAENGYDDSGWSYAAAKDAPIGKLVPQNGPSDRIIRRYQPVEITKGDGGIFKVKFPVEVSGWVALKHLNLREGQKVDIKYISESPGNGSNSYTANGSGDESYHARFTWFVFSEVEIAGLDALDKEQIEAHMVCSDVETAGTFRTSNQLINKINEIWQQSQLDNMHGAIASDCPHRERSPYTGDGQIACATVMYNFSAQTFYNKWIRDIRGAQVADGYVPNSAPWQPGCGGGVGWGAAMEIIPWEFYRHYGDMRVLEQNFAAMRRHVRWMLTWVDPQTGIMHSKDKEKWKNLGDWLPPRELPRNELVHTFFLWLCADITAQTATVLGEDPSEFAAIRDAAAKAFHENFYDPQTGSYGKHGSNVLALRMGVPQDRYEKVVKALRANLAEVNDHIDTGITGTRYLFEVLCDNGMADLAYKIINQRDFPSFGWWIEQGATVTWENWNGADSHNHPMFGGGIGWFYRDLAGLRCREAGYKSFDIRPVVPVGLEWVEYDHKTTYGTISVSWKHKDGRFTLECDIPVGTSATVWMPCSDNQTGYIPHELKSGHYTLVTNLDSRGKAVGKALPKAEILSYNNENLTVDLGVGLWSFPIPYDYDGDGLTDLIVNCPDVPTKGLYYFRNIGTSDDPLFDRAVKLSGKATQHLCCSEYGGRMHVMDSDKVCIDFFNEPYAVKDTVHYYGTRITEGIKKSRSQMWNAVDWDNDGDMDYIAGIDSWDDYGWDNAFDADGVWRRGPLHGWVYLIENQDGRYVNKGKVQAEGKDIDVYGAPNPCIADFDGDSDLDIICGEFLDALTWFENTGTRENPVFAAGRRLRNSDGEIRFHLQMINPRVSDFNKDGFVDLVVGDEDGRVAYLKNTGKISDAMPVYESPVYFRQKADNVKFGALATPVAVDWNNDSKVDIISGNSSGEIAFIENLTGGMNPSWAEPVLFKADGEVIRVQAGSNGSIQGPAEAKWGYTVLDVADWDGDGLKDLIVNSIWGKVEWYRNVGADDGLSFAQAQPVKVAWGGDAPKPEWNWWTPEKGTLVTQWRTSPMVTDWNSDGLPDLIMLDHEGYLAYFERFVDENGEKILKPGKRIFECVNGSVFRNGKGMTDKTPGILRMNDRQAGASGRRKLCMCDWDNDGRVDLIVDSRTAAWFRNVGESQDGTVKLEYMGELSSTRLEGHTTCPTAVDWDNDGKHDLLVGGEDGRFYLVRNIIFG